MAKFFKNPFGQAGIKTPIPNDTQLNGSVSYEQGFTTDYTLDPAFDPVTAKEVPLAETNQYLNDITGAIQQYQTNGYPDFITTADNDGAPYPYNINAFVRYNDMIYISLINNNTDTPPSANWALASDMNPIVKPALVSIDTGQSIPNGGLHRVNFNIVNFDEDGIWDNVNFRFQPIIAGYYEVYCILNLVKNVTGPAIFDIDLIAQAISNNLSINDIIFSRNLVYIGSGSTVYVPASFTVNGSFTAYFNGSSDYIECNILQINLDGVAVPLSTNPNENYFGINYVSP